MGDREITEEPLSVIVVDDPVTCAAYTKKHNLLNLPGFESSIQGPW